VTDSAATGVLPRAYARFHRRHPGIEVRVEVHPTGILLAMLREGSLGVGVGTLPVPDTGGEIEAVPLEREILGLVIPADRKGEPLQRLLRDLPFIGYPAGSTTRRIIDQALDRAAVPVTPRMEIGRPDVMIRLVEAGVGMAVLPESISQASASAGSVHRLPRRRLRAERWLGLLEPREDRSEPAARAFAGVLRELAETPPASARRATPASSRG
jgi:DNA-binding transcriptional LysR family regulator